MPYSSNADLPPGVKNNLPEHAQTIFRGAFNSAFEQYKGNEKTAFRVAWSAVKTKYQQDTKGKWHSKKGTKKVAGMDEELQKISQAERDKIPASDFVDPKGRRFYVKVPQDVADAVSSYGRADPKIPFPRFKRRLTAIAHRKGPAFVAKLPEKWKAEMKKVAQAFAILKANEQTPGWHMNLPIMKKSEDADGNLIIEGYATSENPDNQRGIWRGVRYQGDIIKAKAMEKALQDYMKWGNLREMHQLSAVGVVTDAQVVQGDVPLEIGDRKMTLTNPTWIKAKVVDTEAKKKIKEEVYKDLSIGGPPPKEAQLVKVGSDYYRQVDDFDLTEISVVDRGGNEFSPIVLYKAKGGEQMTDPIQKNVQGAEDIARLIMQLRDNVGSLQYLRNYYELMCDDDDALVVTQMIKLGRELLSEFSEGYEKEEEAEGTDPNAVAQAVVAGVQAVAKVGETQDALVKIGKPFSKTHAEVIHGVIKSMTDMLAAGGDEQACKIQKMYLSRCGYDHGTCRDAGGPDHPNRSLRSSIA